MAHILSRPSHPSHQLSVKQGPLQLGTHLLLPCAGAQAALSPLMLWWALLFGLSSIARYDPETWVGALAVNDSDLAVPIEAALDTALEALPHLILDALTGNAPVAVTQHNAGSA